MSSQAMIAAMLPPASGDAKPGATTKPSTHARLDSGGGVVTGPMPQRR